MALPSGTDVQYIGANASGGMSFGLDEDELISFYGATPAARVAAATQATITATWVTISDGAQGFGFSTSDQIISVIAAIKQIQHVLTTLGLWKGSA